MVSSNYPGHRYPLVFPGVLSKSATLPSSDHPGRVRETDNEGVLCWTKRRPTPLLDSEVARGTPGSDASTTSRSPGLTKPVTLRDIVSAHRTGSLPSRPYRPGVRDDDETVRDSPSGGPLDRLCSTAGVTVHWCPLSFLTPSPVRNRPRDTPSTTV